jgi:hypothetical protein
MLKSAFKLRFLVSWLEILLIFCYYTQLFLQASRSFLILTNMKTLNKKIRVLPVLLLVFVSFISVAQDIPDYRSKKENFLKVREKDIRGDLATFTFAGIEERIGNPPLSVVRPKNYSNKHLLFEGDGIKVVITTGVFEPENHKLEFYEEDHLIKIDKKSYYGSYGEVPGTTIESVSVVLNGDSVQIPRAAYADLYDPAFTYTHKGDSKSLNGIFFSKDGRKVYIYLLNRQRSGSYEVTWVIQDKKYLRRVVDFDLVGM